MHDEDCTRQGRPDDLGAHVQNTKQGPFLDNKKKPHNAIADLGGFNLQRGRIVDGGVASDGRQ
jgi:hypothetical protein